MRKEKTEKNRKKPDAGKKWAKEKTTGSRIKLNIYGRQPLIEALRSGIEMEQVWLAEGLQGGSVQRITRLIRRNEIPVQTVQKNDIQKITGPVVHQGVAASVILHLIPNEEKLSALLKSKENPFVLILDQVQDLHNLGAILRTAEISGVDAVIMPFKGSPEITAIAAKTSAGALFYVPLYRSENLPETFSALQSMSIKIFAALPHSERSMYQADFSGPSAILVGNEGQGVRRNLLPFCDAAIYIPQFGKIQSLNASVSTAVLLYEAVRQRHSRD